MSLSPAQLSRRRFLAGAGVATSWVGFSSALAGTPIIPLRATAQSSSPAGDAAFIWRFEGASPGPTLRVKRDEELRVRLINELTEPTSIHWHGLRLPNAMDGVPHLTQQPVAPGASFDYVFRTPDAGTFWYHGHSPSHLDRGLYGALIVEETQTIGVDQDILLVLAAPFESAGAIRVNGVLDPVIPVRTGERLRLRLINATSVRAFSLKLDGHSPWVMAVDGQPADPFVAREGRVALWPGSRLDLFVDALQPAGAMASILAGSRELEPIARLRYGAAQARPTPRAEPAPLPANPLPGRIDLRNSLKLELALAGGKPFEPGAPPLFTVRRGRAVTLAIRNATGHAHVVHLHGHHFRFLDRFDDGWKPFWLDTLAVGDAVERIAFVADNPGKWLIEWRMLERAGSDGAVWFAVT